MAVISAKQCRPGLRWGILGGIVLTALLVCYGLLRYPTTLTITDESLVLLAMGITLALYAGIALYSTQSKTKNTTQVTQLGIGFGLLIGFLWMIEVLSGNLGDPGNPIIVGIYRGSTLLVVISTLFAGVLGGRQSGRMGQACMVGIWSGLISGLLTACTAMLMTYLFMDTLIHNPQNIQEFLHNPQSAPDMITFLTGDIIVASMSHLLIGPILGIVVSAFGGLLGKGLHLSEQRH
jgi:hypothetical protein